MLRGEPPAPNAAAAVRQSLRVGSSQLLMMVMFGSQEQLLLVQGSTAVKAVPMSSASEESVVLVQGASRRAEAIAFLHHIFTLETFMHDTFHLKTFGMLDLAVSSSP